MAFAKNASVVARANGRVVDANGTVRHRASRNRFARFGNRGNRNERIVSLPMTCTYVAQSRARLGVVVAASGEADAPSDYGDAAFFLKDAPLADLIPAGPWSVIDGGVCAPAGFKAAAWKAGLRASGTRADCALIVADEPAVSAGCFTQNVVAAAPVLFSKSAVAAKDTARAVLVNAGQANAATGEKGMEDTLESARTVAETLGLDDPNDVLIESTGVIGKRIKMTELMRAVPRLAENLEATPAAAASSACVGVALVSAAPGTTGYRPCACASTWWKTNRRRVSSTGTRIVCLSWSRRPRQRCSASLSRIVPSE